MTREDLNFSCEVFSCSKIMCRLHRERERVEVSRYGEIRSRAVLNIAGNILPNLWLGFFCFFQLSQSDLFINGTSPPPAAPPHQPRIVSKADCKFSRWWDTSFTTPASFAVITTPFISPASFIVITASLYPGSLTMITAPSSSYHGLALRKSSVISQLPRKVVEVSGCLYWTEVKF